MNNKIYVSMGTMVGRTNGYNTGTMFDASGKLFCDGFEYMFYPLIYDDPEGHAGYTNRMAKERAMTFPVIHLDKNLCVYLSCSEPGYREKALSDFEVNCRFAKAIGSEKGVLHLWGDRVSDRYFDSCLGMIGELYDIAESYGVLLLVENTPCVISDPLSNFRRLMDKEERVRFIFDTRLSAFHEQHDAFLGSGLFESGMIRHVHVSDFTGPAHDFSGLRPIPHLGCGVADLDRLLREIAKIYDGSITLESPEIHEDRTCPELINRDVEYIRERTRF